MRKPILAAVAVAGLLAGCAAQPDHPTADAGAVVMNHLIFENDVREIRVGDRITFSNSSSRALHVLVVGKDAQPRSQEGAPTFGGASGHRSEVGDRWTTPPWRAPGTYWVTCTLHPSMNLNVIVSEG
jgi:plastocyanin